MCDFDRTFVARVMVSFYHNSIMRRKTMSEIRNAILHSLSGEPKTVNEIAAAIGSDWLTAKRHLDALERCKRVIMIKKSVRLTLYRRA